MTDRAKPTPQEPQAQHTPTPWGCLADFPHLIVLAADIDKRHGFAIDETSDKKYAQVVACAELDAVSSFAHRMKKPEAIANAAFIVRAVNAYDRDQATIEALVKALERIAAFDDTEANERLEHTGSFVWFDEPGSVKIAREALAFVAIVKGEKA